MQTSPGRRIRSLRGAEQARERSLVLLDGFEADPPRTLGQLVTVPGARDPKVQMVLGLGFRLLGVVLAQQARVRLQRAHQRVVRNQLAEVPALGDEGPGHGRTANGYG